MFPVRACIRSSSFILKFSVGFQFKAAYKPTFLVTTNPSCNSQATGKGLFTMQISSAQFQAVMTTDVKFLYELFKKNGYEIRIAGGAVRDLLSGITPKDLDFATTATPEEMRDMFSVNEIRTINLKGESHGTITARINDENYEITTLRIDKITDGRHAVVEFTTNWYLDASRRDLTINAMFLDFDGVLYDYYNGAKDLEEKRIVFVGDPSQRIQEDYLRILRYFRFHGRISDNPEDHDEATISAIKDNAKGLEKISGERIQMELYKILSGKHGIALLKKILSCGVGNFIGLPAVYNLNELNRVSDLIQKHNFVMDPVAILCSIFENEQDTETFTNRIKSSAYHRDLAYFIVEQRNLGRQEPIRYYQKLAMFSNNLKLMVSAVMEYLMYMGEIELLNEFKDWTMRYPAFPVSGNEIMAKIVETDRRWVGSVKKELISIWIESDFKLTKEELINLIPEVSSKCLLSKPMRKVKSKERRRLF